MIKEEERRVLEMVAAGKVTPQEADLLLKALVSKVRLPPRSEGVCSWCDVHRMNRPDKRAVPEPYVREMRAAEVDLTNLDYRDLAEMRRRGVDADFVRALREQGESGLSPDELIDAKRNKWRGRSSDAEREGRQES